METSAVQRETAVQVLFTETTRDDFTLFMDDQVTDFTLLFEKMLSRNDENFPVIMEFLHINNLVAKLPDVHRDMGYTFIDNNCDFSDFYTKWKLVRNLKYLQEKGCDLNLEMFNYLRSLTFGGKLVKRSKNFLQVIQLLLPFCTDFFIDLSYWKKIRYFCVDTKEIIDALNFLITNYGTEKNYRFLPPLRKYNPFSLKHLARNAVREKAWQNKKINKSFNTLCEKNIPVMLFKYMSFMD
ncbi:CLUMA_CG000073, isoform A [Clunio marinus]|uniref:CLUMA_CG000073, isoform A n=1 Tax=Clunio marinus TaxID=568069 RepID=A0A1J1HJB4_9DIPT|nr:CLUMA_CG000073, isoform A [Clunio marinus]